MATPVKDSSFPITLARDLPIHSGTLGSGDSLLGIIGNTTLKRVPISSVTSKVAVTNSDFPELVSYVPPLQAYQGEIHIKGPNGEKVLDYDPETKTLTIGKGITIIQEA